MVQSKDPPWKIKILWKIGTKIYPFPVNKNFWKNWKYSFTSFLPTYYGSLRCKVSKKSLKLISRYKVTQFLAQNWDPINLFAVNRDFSENFIHLIFVYSLFVNMVQSLEKIFRADSKDIKIQRISSYAVLGPKRDQIYWFAPNRDFSENFIHLTFVYSLLLIMMQSLEKILRADLKI